MSSQIHAWNSARGTPVATHDGDGQIYGPMGGTPIAIVERHGDSWQIWQGPHAVGAHQYTLNEDGSVCAGGSGGNRIFTIRGNQIYDGIGGSPFLHCDAFNDPVGLAGAAVAYIGDLRLRSPGANVVPREMQEIANNYTHPWDDPGSSDGGTGFDFSVTGGQHPDPWSNRRVPHHLESSYGSREMSDNINENLRRVRTPVSGNDRQWGNFESSNDDNCNVPDMSYAGPSIDELVGGYVDRNVQRNIKHNNFLTRRIPDAPNGRNRIPHHIEIIDGKRTWIRTITEADKKASEETRKAVYGAVVALVFIYLSYLGVVFFLESKLLGWIVVAVLFNWWGGDCIDEYKKWRSELPRPK